MKRKVQRHRHPCVYQFGDCLFKEDCMWLDVDAAVCAAWLGTKGCRRGNACMFVHGKDEVAVDQFWKRRCVPEKRRKVMAKKAAPVQECALCLPVDCLEYNSRYDERGLDPSDVFGEITDPENQTFKVIGTKLLSRTLPTRAAWRERTITIGKKYITEKHLKGHKTALWQRGGCVRKRTVVQFAMEAVKRTGAPVEMLTASVLDTVAALVREVVSRRSRPVSHDSDSYKIPLDGVLERQKTDVQLRWIPDYHPGLTREANDKIAASYLASWVVFLVKEIAIPAIRLCFPAVVHASKGWETHYPAEVVEAWLRRAREVVYAAPSSATLAEFLRYASKAVEKNYVYRPFLENLLEAAIEDGGNQALLKELLKVKARVEHDVAGQLKNIVKYLVGKIAGCKGVSYADGLAIGEREPSGKDTDATVLLITDGPPGVVLTSRSTAKMQVLSGYIEAMLNPAPGWVTLNGTKIFEAVPSVNAQTRRVVDAALLPENWVKTVHDVLVEGKQRFEQPWVATASLYPAVVKFNGDRVQEVTDDVDVRFFDAECGRVGVDPAWVLGLPLLAKYIQEKVGLVEGLWTVSADGFLVTVSGGKPSSGGLSTVLDGVVRYTEKDWKYVEGVAVPERLWEHGVSALEGKLYPADLPVLLTSPHLNTPHQIHKNLLTALTTHWGAYLPSTAQSIHTALSHHLTRLSVSTPSASPELPCVSRLNTIAAVAAALRTKRAPETLATLLDVYDLVTAHKDNLVPCEICSELGSETLRVAKAKWEAANDFS